MTNEDLGWVEADGKYTKPCRANPVTGKVPTVNTISETVDWDRRNEPLVMSYDYMGFPEWVMCNNGN